MATHSSVLAWRIPGTGEPGGLPSMRSHRAGHDWSDLAAVAAAADILLCAFSVPHDALNKKDKDIFPHWYALCHPSEAKGFKN